MLNPDRYIETIKCNTNNIFSVYSSYQLSLVFLEGSYENCPAVLPVGGRIS